jgi:hypothetical protein
MSIRPNLRTGDRYRPTTDIRISPREILAPSWNRRAEDPHCLFIRYRTFDDGRSLPLVRTCTIYSFWRWIEKWGALLAPDPGNEPGTDSKEK